MTDFALCVTCPELTTGRTDSSKGFLLAESSNHNNCEVIPLDLGKLTGPLKFMAMKLGAGVPISNIDISMFKLGYEMSDLWRENESRSVAPAAMSSLEDSPVPVPLSDASTRSLSASASTSRTGVSDEGMLW